MMVMKIKEAIEKLQTADGNAELYTTDGTWTFYIKNIRVSKDAAVVISDNDGPDNPGR